MVDVGLRDLGAFVPGRKEPALAPVAAAGPAPSVIVTPPPASRESRTVFAGDLPSGPDTLGIEMPLLRLAELVAHRGTATPLCIGLFGGAGSGKSFGLQRLVDRVREIGTATKRGGPFLDRLHVQILDASALEGDAALALAARLHAGLRPLFPDLARDIGYTARDPRIVLRETGEKLDDSRRRLDAERRTLEESGSRLARLTETVLYEAAGSQVDSYARAHRTSLESRMTAFGVSGDPIRSYKDLVRTVSESGAFGLSLRALHGFKGQSRLIALAVVFCFIGVSLGVAIDMRESWLTDLRAGPQAAATSADWLASHIGLLALARKGAYAIAALAVLFNLWRAFSFIRPILTGDRLLKADLAARRRDLEGLYAHQTKRVDGLTADVERLARHALEAEKRAGAASHEIGGADPSPFEQQGTQARDFFLELARLLHEGSTKAEPTTPRRIVLALDHFEAVAADRARAIVETVYRIASECGLVVLMAMDTSRLGASVADLERWVQVPVRLDAKTSERDYTAIVQQALGHPALEDRRSGHSSSKIDVTRSVLDEPVSEAEAGLLAALAPLAGGSPRAAKRLVNLFRLARLDSDAPKGSLALMLALDQGGTTAERRSIETATTGEPGAALDPRDASPRLRSALDAVEAVDGRLTKADVAMAAARAALFSVAPLV